MSTTERPTPETDAAQIEQNVRNQGVPDKDWPWAAISSGFDFARKLERERDEAREASRIICERESELVAKLCYERDVVKEMRSTIKEAAKLVQDCANRCSDATIQTHSDDDAKGALDDTIEWSESALAKLRPLLQ